MSDSSNHTTIPLSIVLLSIGAVLVATAATIAYLVPSTLTSLGLPPAVAERLPARAVERRVEGSQDSTRPSTGLILLPETPLLAAGGLPSEATVADAPRQLPAMVAGQPTRLRIPSIGVDAPVIPVQLVPVAFDGQVFSQWEVPGTAAAGWHSTSAPVGAIGNTVLNGHNNIYGELFRDLVNVKSGDELILSDGEKPLRYLVTEIHTLPEQGQPVEVRLQNARWIAPTEDERVTIVSCWPYESNSHRLVVVAHPVPG